MGHRRLILFLFALFAQDSTAQNHENTNNLILENECGVRKESEKSLHIDSGSPAAQGDHPWMVSLSLKEDPAHHICGGTIISPKHILTAAHCLMKYRTKIKADDILVSFGGVNLKGNLTVIGSYRYEMQDDYHFNSWTNDIAIIRLEKKVPFSEHVRPICLPKKNDPSYRIGTKVYITGWGDTGTGSGTEILMEAEVRIRGMDECETLIEDETYEKLLICAGDQKGSKDTCRGDSGGPLIARRKKDGRWIQLGITSWGRRICGEGNDTMGMYTKVDQYLDWIAEFINKN